MPVQARIRYLNDEWRRRPDIPEIGDRESRRANTSKHTVSIFDARPKLERGEIDFDANGFTLLEHASAVQDFQDDEQIKAVYYPEIVALAKRVTGASEVFITQHVVRTEDKSDFNKAYARFLHCDYSLDDAHATALRLVQKRGLALADYESKEFAWYNAWQPFDHDAVKNPLALLDATSLSDDDIVNYRYTGYSKNSPDATMEGKSAIPAHSPTHRLYYVSGMTPRELLFFKQLDTRRRGGVCPHTSFDDPASPPDAPPRRSIETRLMAVFG